MSEPILIAKSSTQEVFFLPQMGNRHGLITGATGTGKTVSLQALAQHFSDLGTPVFMADVKGDLTGISQAGGDNDKVKSRLQDLGLPELNWAGAPTTLWDVFGEKGHPVRATISDMGPLLLSRMLDLNDTQAGVLTMVFKIADDNQLLLLDLKDLRSMLQFVGDNAKQFTTDYGNVSAASIGAIQRGLLTLESQGGDQFFGEPMLNIDDMMQTVSGKGVINIMAADKLMQSPRLYGAFLLWMLSELFERLPEVGDVDKPKFAFFFDEAHLLFNDAPKVLLEKIEQVVRLIRSKGVGVYFVTQNPIDIPDTVLGQLGNRVQHALRAFTPRDQKAVRSAAETFVVNPNLKVVDAIIALNVGEALVSFLEEGGRPAMVERAWIMTPECRIGTITPEERSALRAQSPVGTKYDEPIDRESAFEILKARAEAPTEAAPPDTPPAAGGGWSLNWPWAKPGEAAPPAAPAPSSTRLPRQSGTRNPRIVTSSPRSAPAPRQPPAPKPAPAPRASNRQGVGETFAKSVVRTVGSQLGRQILRGIFGSMKR